MINIILGYMLVIILELGILPIETWLHNNFENKEIARKWGHVLCGTIIWVCSYLFLKDTIHSIIIPILYTIIVTLFDHLGFINDSRENPEIGDNPKSTPIAGIGYTLLATISYFNPEWWLYYGLGVFSLCFGDALAALVGIKYGKYSLSLPHHKSLIGSIGFLVASIIGMIIVCLIMRINAISILSQLIILSIAGSIVEVFSGEWDNFLIQVTVAVLAFILF